VNAWSFGKSALRATGLVCGAILLSTCQTMAQTGRVNACGTTCAEVLVQYYDDGKVAILDSKTRQEIAACHLCDPKDASCKRPACKAGGTISDATTLHLLKSHRSPGCTTFCNSRTGTCTEYCN